MKLLTWMHRKFRQGGSETLKDYHYGFTGQPLLDDIQQYQKQTQGNGALRQQVHRERLRRKSFATLEITKLADLEEKASAEFSEYFEGFLAIGTLGSTEIAIVSEPETPTFAVSFEKLAEGETEVTVNELRLINDELERVLAVDTTKDDCWTDSSSRNSHVSNGRNSHASSTITLSGKPLEIPDSGAAARDSSCCPLQEYLLGSAIEFPERAVTVAKKENRTSLGELFEKHKAEEISETNNKQHHQHKRGGDHKRDDKDGVKTSMNLVKKILKKKILHADSKNSSRETSDSSNADTKLVKILHKFQKKVHPECCVSTQKSDKARKIGIKDMIPCNAGYYKDNETFFDENMATLSQRAQHNGHMRITKSRSIPHQFCDEGGSDSNGSRECWIKTDADYLVLEL